MGFIEEQKGSAVIFRQFNRINIHQLNMPTHLAWGKRGSQILHRERIWHILWTADQRALVGCRRLLLSHRFLWEPHVGEGASLPFVWFSHVTR